MLKVCICAIAKNENKYIKEWVDYHINLSIDKIFLYDNNDIGSEKLTDVISETENVKIIDIRGRKENWLQKKIYTKFWFENKDNFDWIIFIDIDEFIILKSDKTIKEFLSRSYFNNVDIIRLNWMHFTDNNELDVINDDYNVLNRFKIRNCYYEDIYGKSILRTSIDIGNDEITAHGYHNKKLIAVDACGNVCLNENWIVNNKPNYEIAWINHYRTKTIGEYVKQKYFRGDLNIKTCNRYALQNFWQLNNKTEEKEKYANSLIQKYNK